MSLEEDKRIIDTIRQCQRNWDLSREIPMEHIDHWSYIASHSPSKQDEGYYNVRIIKNKDLISLLKQHTWGQTINVSGLEGVARNSQMAGSVYILFTEKHSETAREIDISGKPINRTDIVKIKNASISAGIAGGLIAESAARLGYKVGFNTNHSEPEIWHKVLSIPYPRETLMFGIGIGFPQEGRPRNETDETEFYIGGYPGMPGYQTGLPNNPNGTPGTLYKLGGDSFSYNGKEYYMPKVLRYTTFSQITKNVNVWVYK